MAHLPKMQITQGLYVLGLKDSENRNTGCVIASLTQIETSPETVIISTRKNSYTSQNLCFDTPVTISILSRNCSPEVIKNFGYLGGYETTKWDSIDAGNFHGMPILTERNATGCMYGKICGRMEFRTHCLWFIEITDSLVLSTSPAMTLQYFREEIEGGITASISSEDDDVLQDMYKSRKSESDTEAEDGIRAEALSDEKTERRETSAEDGQEPAEPEIQTEDTRGSVLLTSEELEIYDELEELDLLEESDGLQTSEGGVQEIAGTDEDTAAEKQDNPSGAADESVSETEPAESDNPHIDTLPDAGGGTVQNGKNTEYESDGNREINNIAPSGTGLAGEENSYSGEFNSAVSADSDARTAETSPQDEDKQDEIPERGRVSDDLNISQNENGDSSLRKQKDKFVSGSPYSFTVISSADEETPESDLVPPLGSRQDDSDSKEDLLFTDSETDLFFSSEHHDDSSDGTENHLSDGEKNIQDGSLDFSDVLNSKINDSDPDSAYHNSSSHRAPSIASMAPKVVSSPPVVSFFSSIYYCPICKYEYHGKIPANFVCPVCGFSGTEFEIKE